MYFNLLIFFSGKVKIDAPSYLSGVVINQTSVSGLKFVLPGNAEAKNFTMDDSNWYKGNGLGYTYDCNGCYDSVRIYNRLTETPLDPNIDLQNVLDSFVDNNQ